MVAMGLWRGKGLFGGIGRKERDTVEHAIAAVGLTGFEGRADRHAVGRADAAHAVRAAAAAGRARDRARRAVQRDRRQDLGRSARPGAALARREAHRARGAARSRAGQGEFPRDAAAGARAGGLGRDRRRADAGEPAQGAAHVRGVRRAGARPASWRRNCRASTTPSSPRSPSSSSCAARWSARFALALGAGADRRVPDAAAHEPGRRRHGACDPARRGDRLPASRGSGCSPWRRAG